MAARTRLPLLFTKNLPRLTSQKLAHTEAVLKEPVYPPIVASLTAKSKSAERRREEERIQRKCAASVEDKISMITSLQRMKYVIYPQTFARGADRWYQHYTKTAYISGLPDKFAVIQNDNENTPPVSTSTTGINEDALAEIRALIARVILQEHWWTVKKRRPFLYRNQELVIGPLLRNLVSGLTHNLAKYNPLLLQSSLDMNPQVNFYWRRGQRIIPKGHRKGRVEPRRFQIDDHPHSQIRVTQQLPQFALMEDSYAVEVPEITCAPDMLPMFKRQYENHIYTGAKLPDPACYGHTQFHLVPDRYHRDRMARQQQSDQIEVFLRANAVASLFAWTGAQAMYQGFWSHQDVIRPFVSQAVITDGKFFSFFCYQLNTVALSVQTDVDNPRKNVLWGTESLPLYDTIEDGEVVGMNDDVVKLLVQFLMNRP
ncbi:39S ribosomal protein S30, mitochondrial [Boleophthalmus pectinirostris]|uniref:39S ribosomal protein S30, mitochondrial n=1 Tax=Boleophthalmus pectinirostris TaxID=150288 RepID=UPI00242AAAB4|nr:39S ribosomal protein S30, mitochondrial [Boleophthalmus pectinirostris]